MQAFFCIYTIFKKEKKQYIHYPWAVVVLESTPWVDLILEYRLYYLFTIMLWLSCDIHLLWLPYKIHMLDLLFHLGGWNYSPTLCLFLLWLVVHFLVFLMKHVMSRTPSLPAISEQSCSTLCTYCCNSVQPISHKVMDKLSDYSIP